MLRRSSRKVKKGENDIADGNPVPSTMKVDVVNGNNAVEENETDVEDEFWDEDDDEEDTDKNSEDEDSDYGKRHTIKAPAKKRAKTSQSKAPPSKSVRRRKSLSMLPTMPLDILFEIFSHLSPKDILNLSRTSKIFHETLSSRNSIVTWKAARERVSVPAGPDWISEAAWADLLFAHNCQSCGTRNIQNVDFLLLKRLCLSCKKRHYVLRAKVEKRYPEADFVILDLVLSTNISAWSTWARSSYYYWDRDLESMISKLAALKDDGNAQQTFMQEQKRRRQYIHENSTSWQRWHERMQSDRSQETKEAEEKRLHQVEDKFKELGYLEEDLYRLRYQKECHGRAQLTDKIWNRIRPILEPDVQAIKIQRLERELVSLKCDRRRILYSRYNDFKRTLQPSQWKYLPRPLEITAFEPFSRHIEADVGVEVDETTFDDAFLELPNLLSTAAEQRKVTLRAMIDATPKENGEIWVDPLELATAVFKCDDDHCMRYVFGRDEIASHHCRTEMEGAHPYHYAQTIHKTPLEFNYSPKIGNVVRRLAQLAGLDTATATATDFDEKDLRFGCEYCTMFKQSGQYYRFGYSWRDLATHLEAGSHNPDLRITVLPDDVANELKQCERNDRKWAANQWTCSHCPEHLGNPQSRQIVERHLFEAHGIQTPSEPRDFFFFERYRKDWSNIPKYLIPQPKNLPPAPKSQFLNQNSSAKFRCLMCPRGTNRVFILKGVDDHLRAKHSISFAQSGVHYALG